LLLLILLQFSFVSIVSVDFLVLGARAIIFLPNPARQNGRHVYRASSTIGIL
jgi:hypothetical protein